MFAVAHGTLVSVPLYLLLGPLLMQLICVRYTGVHISWGSWCYNNPKQFADTETNQYIGAIGMVPFCGDSICRRRYVLASSLLQCFH